MEKKEREISALYWFAIHVKSRHEFQVNERLTKAGFSTFLPTIQRMSRWRDRNKLISFPLFPCYLFVNITKNHTDKSAILKTKGVVRFLGSMSGEPEVVPEEQILSLKKLIDCKVDIDPYPYLQEGQKIRIVNGPLSGVEGVLVEKSGQHKLVLSVDILCQSTAVSIQASDVERI